MKRLFYGGIAVLLFCAHAYPQISPGKLSSAHESLEGINNCTQCHNLGKEISGEKCLQCHKEIQQRINAQHGFHFKKKNEDCIVCHKDHRGKEVSLLRWDKKNFLHDETGYGLEGRHRTLKCEQCHTKSNIRDEDILKKSNAFISKTFLGLHRECLSCHEDEHRGQLNTNCLQCHSYEQWKPAEKFSHNEARFLLKGKHANVRCQKCHTAEINGNLVRLKTFKPLQFQQCHFCHNDVHGGKLGASCNSCHSEDGWKIIAEGKFNHSNTRFPLLGKHQNVVCGKCHKEKRGEKKFSDRTFALCSDCHSDYHRGDFKERADKGKCEGCHTIEGFSPSTFSVVLHNETTFKLTGAHEKIQCNQCHKKENSGSKEEYIRFRWKELRCQSCHTDIHSGQFATRMKDKGCLECHLTTNWKSLLFSHDSTVFPLVGLHQAVSCKECHKIVTLQSNFNYIQFTGTQKQCNECHTDVHFGQFKRIENNQTKCEQCHSARGWSFLQFEHNTQSQFRLDGKHAQLFCEDCHKKTTQDGNTFTRYKPLSPLCESCHAKR
ncbi:MAG: cytochrome C [Ignavibacteria bacterium]|nr:cytochrome C [Ignavibacteria bacterium]